jgi:hypothetical protein
MPLRSEFLDLDLGNFVSFMIAGNKDNQFKGSIYMVFDYMDHDLTGLMERQNHKFTLPQVCMQAS